MYGSWKVAKLTNHVSVGYIGTHRGRICVPANYSTHLCGICANYNNQQPDDLRYVQSYNVVLTDNNFLMNIFRRSCKASAIVTKVKTCVAYKPFCQVQTEIFL